MDDRAILSFDGERLTGLTMRGGVVSPSVGEPAPGEDADRIAAQNTDAVADAGTATATVRTRIPATPATPPAVPPAADSLLGRLQALIQHYYGHIEQKNYTVEE